MTDDLKLFLLWTFPYLASSIDCLLITDGLKHFGFDKLFHFIRGRMCGLEVMPGGRKEFHAWLQVIH
jgi:hypothetical protein